MKHCTTCGCTGHSRSLMLQDAQHSSAGGMLKGSAASNSLHSSSALGTWCV